MTDILQAARSYYGMDSTPVGKCEMYTNEHGSMRLVIEIPVTGDDFIAIGQRMKAMEEAESHEQPDTAIIEGPTVEAMREAYNALSKAEKGRYGSFARYMAESSTEIKRQVVHVDAPEEPEPASMDAVWLLGSQIPAELQFLSSDQRVNEEHGDIEYLIQWAMLTDEQKQKAKEKP